MIDGKVYTYETFPWPKNFTEIPQKDKLNAIVTHNDENYVISCTDDVWDQLRTFHQRK